MAMTCERCGGYDTFADADGRRLRADFTDYCAVCSKNLCESCMAEGCCGSVPAKSGSEDYDETAAQRTWEKAKARKAKQQP